MEVYEGEKIVQGYVIGQEMQEAVVIPQAAASAAAEQSAPVVPIPMEQGQNGPRESRETARATIRAEQMARQGHEEVRNFYVVWTNH